MLAGFRLPFSAALLLHAAALSGVQAVVVGPVGAGKSGKTSLTMVDGRPAIAWSDTGSLSIRYARALDANGVAWGEVKTVDSSPTLGRDVSLRVVNGRPAVCCVDQGSVRFIRANDAAGDTWPLFTPVFLNSGLPMAVMEVIGGRAAILANGGGPFVYLRATDPDATNWAAPAPVATPDGVNGISLTQVQAVPAALFSSSITQTGGGLWYTRGMNVNGTAWTAPKALTEWTEAVSCSLQVVQNLPVAATFLSRDTTSDLTFVRATDPLGSSWQTQSVVIQGGSVPLRSEGAHLALASVNGKPAISFASGTSMSELLYTQARDSTGASSEVWEMPGKLDSEGHAGFHPSLLEVNGSPAIAYVSESEGVVKYLRATVAGGSTRWPPQLSLRHLGAVLERSTTITFIPATLGTTATITLTVHNPGLMAAPLDFVDFSLAGPDAGEFSLLSFPSGPLSAGAESSLVLACTPASPGIKSAVLRIRSNDGVSPNPRDFMIYAECLPDLTVERPGGTPLFDNVPADFPSTPPGTSALLTFVLKNSGGAPVEGVVLSFEGPNNTEFSIVTPPPAVLAPGSTNAVVVRHAPLTAGTKNATLKIAGNFVTGGRSPYEIHLRMITGVVDETFAPQSDPCLCVALEPEGRILVGGQGTVFAWKPDGSPDLSFFSPALDGAVRCIAVQRDGGILLGGDFSLVNGLSRPGLARLFRDGGVDPAFDAMLTPGVTCIGIQPNGKILVGGGFQSRSDPTRRNLVRLQPDVSLDTSFAIFFSDPITSFTPLPAGRWLVSDLYSDAPNSLNLLDPDGIGESFTRRQLTGNLQALAWRPDDFIVGCYTAGGVVRMPLNGPQSFPSGVVPMQMVCFSLGMQADGACLAAGDVQTIADSVPRVRRLAANGAVESGFDTGVDGPVRSIALQEDGKVILAGGFNSLGGFERSGLARLTNDPSISVLTRSGAAALRWMRGGTAPEVSDVSFERNTPGENSWSLLGFGSRIPGGWELSGLNLPDTCQIRARARAGGSLLQSMVSFSASPLSSWRLQYFNTSENSGPAADDADPDLDGLTNFTEFAFGLNPADRTSSALPEFKYANNSFTATFTAPEGREDLLYSAETSPSMLPGTWTAIPNSDTGEKHVFSVPAGGEARMYVRFVVTR